MSVSSDLHRTTARHFAIFKAECERCIDHFRIVGWRVEYVHEDLVDARARCRSNAVDQVAVLVLSTIWRDIAPTDNAVLKSARHEVIHLIVDPLDELCQFRWVTQDQHRHALESVVRHLEEILP